MKNKILALTILAFTSMNAMAQEEVNVTGKVVDKVGNPVSGAAVSVLGATTYYGIDRRYGKFYNFSIKGCSALDSDAV